MIGIMFVLVLYLQMARGYTALETGLVVLPDAVLTAAGSAYAGRLADRFGGRYILAAGPALLAAGLLVLVAMTGPTGSAWTLLPGLLVIGIASGATYAPLQQATMDGVDPRLAGAASGVSGTIRQVGGVLGTAMLGALLSPASPRPCTARPRSAPVSCRKTCAPGSSTTAPPPRRTTARPHRPAA
ncbi:MFS transporter [Actinomadura keratinilytica]|jgi:MFS family permease|uniref:Major facilitator superfamily (MFS) profile domain-containing protein n=1 Tax=Actinomadura keratinilytica TaxID=547461 RepID=A0ABP7Z4Z1_9ACTN